MAVQNDYMTVAYRLYVRDEGEDEEVLVEMSTKDKPFRFITHLGCVLPAFEEAMEPLKTGDEFNIVIPHEKAYGEVDDSRIFDVPKDVSRSMENSTKRTSTKATSSPCRTNWDSPSAPPSSR